MIPRALALLALLPLTAHAADMTDCRAYANRGSAAALRQLINFPFLADPAVGRFLYRKAYGYCLNSDEVPVLAFTAEEQPIIDGMPSPPTRPEPLPGSVAATDPADDAPAEPVAPAAPKPKKARASSGGQPQALCTRHGKRTVYSGLHWRCVK